MSVLECVAPQRFYLSGNQQRFWSEREDAQRLLIQVAVLVEGHLDIPRLQFSIRRVVERHEIFRTRFDRVESIKYPFQVVITEPIFSWEEADGKGNATPESLLKFARERFPFPADPPLHALFAPISEDVAVLVLTLPALCGDLGTLDILVRELADQYGAEDNRAVGPDLASVQYIQFSEWQRSLLKDDDLESGREYWRQKLLDIPRAIQHFPFESGRVDHRKTVDQVCRTELNGGLPSKIRAIAAEFGTEPQVVLFACWSNLLWQLDDLTPHATWITLRGRDHKMLSTICGPLATHIPACCGWDSQIGTADAMVAVVKFIRDSKDWSLFYRPEQFEEQVLTELRIGFECDQSVHCVSANGVQFSKALCFCCPENIDLKLVPLLGPDTLSVQVYFNSTRFSPTHAHNFVAMFEASIANLDARTPFAALELQSESDARSTIGAHIGKCASANLERTLTEIFEEQVQHTPGQVAVIGKDQTLSFAELNRKANQVANYLISRGITVEDRVAIYLDRTAEVLVGILGILKASAAYVPLDPVYPKNRLNYVLRDAGCRIVLTQQSFLARFEQIEIETLCLDFNLALAEWQDHNPPQKSCPGNLAYLIYTSGSTGKPKGVMIQHRSVVSLLESLSEALGSALPVPMRVAVNAPIVFDASVKQWIQVLKGHTVCFVPEEARLHPESLTRYLEETKIDLMDATPSHFKLIMEAAKSLFEENRGMVLLGGEAIDDQTWKYLKSISEKKFYNVYGPTECTVDATVCPIANSNQPSIGYPIQGVQLYVLNQSLKPAPKMLSGELYIGGEGLARGYWNQPGLTAERFLPNPFSDVPGSRFYRTGDLVCQSSDGTLKFLGRADDQVKLRGYRLELGEIESVLREVRGVHDTLVLMQGHDEKSRRLVSYVVREAGGTVSTKEIKEHARQQLPDYMVPTAFAIVDRLPLNVNGKVDRNGLPEISPDSSDGSPEYTPPRGETERILAAFWQQILGVQKFGIHDNFFDLGGNSLLMVQMHRKIQDKFEKAVPMVELFRNPTIAMLSHFISEGTSNSSLSKAKKRAANRIAAANRIK